MEMPYTIDESAGASNGSAYVSCHRWIIKRDDYDSRTLKNGSESSVAEKGRESAKSYLDVMDVRPTHVEFQAICQRHNNSGDADGYLEVRQVINSDDSNGYLRAYEVKNTERDENDGYLHSMYHTSNKYLREDEITIQFNEKGNVLDMHGYLKLCDVKPCGPIQNKKVVKCIQKERYEQWKRSYRRMKQSISVLVGLVLVTLCLFLLALFGILNGKVCSPPPPCLPDIPLKYTYSMGDNATIRYVLPTHFSNSTIYVDLHRTRVRNQDERLLQVENVNKPNTASIESGRISAMLTKSDGLIDITIKIQGTQCHDHGYIVINVSGILIVNVQLNITAPVKECPHTAVLNWNKTEFINCSACVGNAKWNVTWYRDRNGTYVPIPETNYSNVLTPLPLANNLVERVVSTVEFDLGVVFFKLVIRRTFCSDSGTFKVLILPESIEQNVTITVKGYLESCTPRMELTLIMQMSKTCSLCIGETSEVSNLTITRTVPETFNIATTQLMEREGNVKFSRDSLMIETNLISGLLTILFKWSRVQCTDEGYYEIVALGKYGVYHRNINISIYELGFLTPPVITKGHGGYVEGYNLSMACSVQNMACKMRELTLSLPNSNTTYECKNISLDTENRNDSYACSLSWTEFNISNDLNGTTFYCGYNYTHYNGTLFTLQTSLTIFVIPSNTCSGLQPRCQIPHPLGGGLFIECDSLNSFRPWEMTCPINQVFKPAQKPCEGQCG
ncbi:hypothetical protein ACJMK2_017973 [Sinanodonta woodiana]|uniref:Uncharacterized protein n=1 Tax=Sinanodonta woodiana TaxID=1069815 RepID=A0ABD3UC32_SINWO